MRAHVRRLKFGIESWARPRVRLKSMPKAVSAITGAKTLCMLVSTHGCSISSRGSRSTPAAQCWIHLSFFAATTVSESGSPRITSASAAALRSSAGSLGTISSAFVPARRMLSISSGRRRVASRMRMGPAEGEGSKRGYSGWTTASAEAGSGPAASKVPPAVRPARKPRRENSCDMALLLCLGG